MELSKRTKRLEPSVTLAAAAKAKALKAKGRDVLSLTVGEPDLQHQKTSKKQQSKQSAMGKLAIIHQQQESQSFDRQSLII